MKADANGIAKVTEINIRYVAYNCLLANAGFNLAEYHLITTLGQSRELSPELEIQFPKNNMWLRDVDALPIYIENPKNLGIGEYV